MTATPTLARAERAAISDLFDELGPDAPTLCEGWVTRDLAAHLALREGSLVASTGIIVSPLSGWTRHVQDKLARKPWADLVAKVRSGPPRWAPMARESVDTMANGLEYFVHHEDVRRAQPTWEPRFLPPAHEEFLWGMLEKRGTSFYRKAPSGVALRDDQGREIVARDGTSSVVITGRPSELALFTYGRKDVAQVDLSGGDDDIDALRATSLGV